MKSKKVLLYCLTVVMLLSMTVGAVLAEDGVLFRRDISKTPDNETEKAAIYMMDFYVLAQSSAGIVGPVDNYGIYDTGEVDGELNPITISYGPRDYAKPLISVYIDDLHPEETKGGISFGHFDAFVGVSLDDGTSWKTTNLSRSSDLSSFTLTEGYNSGYDYPGDVHNVVHQVAGDIIFVSWVSKYCDGGTPLYTLAAEIEEVLDEDELGTGEFSYGDPYLDDLATTYAKDDIYLMDYFGVAGEQRSVNYEEQGFPEIGEIPFSCVWTARGKLIPGDDPSTEGVTSSEGELLEGNEASYVLWTKPERLTSGRRDANLPAVDCAEGAGCILTWQEDPEGLRPGQGLGPGEGWSGAIANGQTDIWYSYIDFEDFDDVVDEVVNDDESISEVVVPMEEYTGTTIPKAYVPMAMPFRLTDNHMCKTGKGDDNLESQQLPYCFADFSTSPVTLYTTPQLSTKDESETVTSLGASTYCSETVAWTTPGGATLTICKAQDGRVLNGRVASTRVRLNLKPYDSDADTINDSAWVVMAYEETKAFGDILVDDPSTEVVEDDPIEIGKDIWYHSFDMFDHDLVDQGGMINQPTQFCETDEDGVTTCLPDTFTPFVYVDENGDGVYDKDEDGYITDEIGWADPVYYTEIARRFAVTTNSIPSILSSTSDLSAMLIYKQGIINQGGPADIFLRRVIAPDKFETTGINPYAFENIDCAEWATFEEPNTNYLQGVCLSPAINISGTTITRCDTFDSNGTLTSLDNNDDCAAAFPVDDDGSIPEEIDISKFPKVMEWRQCDGESKLSKVTSWDTEGTPVSEIGTECSLIDNDLDDQSWENPFDVAKGHRGFLDGDIVMMMYAWSPNWNSNAVGNDHYNLYVRRSFDGGQTWTTTPESLDDEAVGLTAIENYYGEKIGEPVPVEWSYDTGDFEQARNVSLLIGNKVTILDPRYTPSGGLKLYSDIDVDWLLENYATQNTDGSITDYTPTQDLPYEDDAGRDPSKFFIVYETGDNTTVAEGEAVPLDLFYSRATVYGDIYEWMEYLPPDKDTTDDEEKDTYFAWPWLEKAADDLSGEASIVANPGGTFMYAVWNQWQEEIIDDHEFIFNSDIIFRRLEYLVDELVGTVTLKPKVEILDDTQLVLGTDEDDVILLFASAIDLDTVGDDPEIIEFEWFVNGQPIPESYEAFGVDCFKSNVCKVPARVISGNWDGFNFANPGWSGDDGTGTFTYGYYTFQVRAKDNDDQWSNMVQLQKYISKSSTDLPVELDSGFKIFLPLTTK